MEIQCRAAELKANSQSLALRRQMPLAGSAQNPRGWAISPGLPAWIHPLSCGLLPKNNIPWSPFSPAQAVPGHLAGAQPPENSHSGKELTKVSPKDRHPLPHPLLFNLCPPCPVHTSSPACTFLPFSSILWFATATITVNANTAQPYNSPLIECSLSINPDPVPVLGCSFTFNEFNTVCEVVDCSYFTEVNTDV